MDLLTRRRNAFPVSVSQAQVTTPPLFSDVRRNKSSAFSLYKTSHRCKVITWGKVVLLIKAAVSDIGLCQKPRFVTATNNQWEQC